MDMGMYQNQWQEYFWQPIIKLLETYILDSYAVYDEGTSSSCSWDNVTKRKQLSVDKLHQRIHFDFCAKTKD